MRTVPVIVALAVVGCSTPKPKPPKPAPLVTEPAAPAEPTEPATAEPTEPAAAPIETAAESPPPPTSAGAEPTPAQNPLAELSALGEQVLVGGPDAGGSIRAKRDPPVSAVRANPLRLRAKVEAVIRGRFPVAAVRVRILAPAKGGPATGLEKNDVVVVLPRLAVEHGRVNLKDGATTRNAGAFYLSKGDRVHLRLESKRADGVWWAEAIARD